MYCTHCGRELEEVARYCSACGTARQHVPPVEDTHRERPALSRPVEGAKVAGVCAGVARYFDMDVTLVRILWLLAAIFPPVPGLIAYLVCWIAMPKDDPRPACPTPTPVSTASQSSHA
jgi:phage shock protein C